MLDFTDLEKEVVLDLDREFNVPEGAYLHLLRFNPATGKYDLIAALPDGWCFYDQTRGGEPHQIKIAQDEIDGRNYYNLNRVDFFGFNGKVWRAPADLRQTPEAGATRVWVWDVLKTGEPHPPSVIGTPPPDYTVGGGYTGSGGYTDD